MPKRNRDVKGEHCAGCRGYRLHTIRTVRDGTGKVTRDLVCSVCEGVTRVGISCTKCQDCRFHVEYTRHRAGGTVRVKSCRTCGHRIRTREIVEAG
ncbi:unnamed protein product [Gemmata massiliana]|uniref:Uncharacterized protein n=1 Tax=Gemmata massiliana TaxID=1210884 RepID=A0A6P2DKB9_9BACT|nr:hypothetical protein [Gemmata massiliana]VTS03815.1 unnamed protein product [Gemmata massiliana]